MRSHVLPRNSMPPLNSRLGRLTMHIFPSYITEENFVRPACVHHTLREQRPDQRKTGYVDFSHNGRTGGAADIQSEAERRSHCLSGVHVRRMGLAKIIDEWPLRIHCPHKVRPLVGLRVHGMAACPPHLPAPCEHSLPRGANHNPPVLAPGTLHVGGDILSRLRARWIAARADRRRWVASSSIGPLSLAGLPPAVASSTG